MSDFEPDNTAVYQKSRGKLRPGVLEIDPDFDDVLSPKDKPEIKATTDESAQQMVFKIKKKKKKEKKQ